MGQRYEKSKKNVTENRHTLDGLREDRETLQKEYAPLSAFESLQGLLDDEATEAIRHVSDVGVLETNRIESETDEAEKERQKITEDINSEIEKLNSGLDKLNRTTGIEFGKDAVQNAKQEYKKQIQKFKDLIGEINQPHNDSGNHTEGIASSRGYEFEANDITDEKHENRDAPSFGSSKNNNTLFGDGSFLALLTTNQTSEVVMLNGVMSVVFDHPFDENSTRVCNQGSAYPTGPQGTCGCCACGTIINKAGGKTNEHETVAYAWNNGLCSNSGGTSPESWVGILGGAGISSHVSSGTSLENLAREVEQGHGVVIGVSACTYCPELYGHYFPGKADGHALVLESVVRNQATGQIIEYIVSDSNGKSTRDACRRVPANVMEKAFKRKKSLSVVTNDVIW